MHQMRKKKNFLNVEYNAIYDDPKFVNNIIADNVAIYKPCFLKMSHV